MKILIVEDEELCLSLILQALKPQKYTIDFSRNGNEGFEKARTNKYDAILLDVMMPGKTGFEILSGLRALNIKTPVMILSGRSMVEDKVLGLNLGADDYMTKNFAPQELIARINNLIRRTPQTGKNILRHKDLVINFSNMQISRQETILSLSRKEIGILTELLKHKNKVRSRQELISAVWGDRDIEVDSNTIDVHIKSLRSKIDRPFPEALITTVRGFGYIVQD